MQYSKEEQAYRDKLIKEIETMVTENTAPITVDRPKLKVVK